MREVDLEVADKSTLVASDRGLRKEIAGRLGRSRVKITTAEEAKHLGIDRSVGRTNKRATHTARRKKAEYRTKKLATLLKG